MAQCTGFPSASLGGWRIDVGSWWVSWASPWRGGRRRRWLAAREFRPEGRHWGRHVQIDVVGVNWQ
ncbi:MAG: hypothetical protein ACE5EL_05230, partial [Anaerolineae bacterium]